MTSRKGRKVKREAGERPWVQPRPSARARRSTGRGPLVGLTTGRPPPQHRAVVNRRCARSPPPLVTQPPKRRAPYGARGERGADTARTARGSACSRWASRRGREGCGVRLTWAEVLGVARASAL